MEKYDPLRKVAENLYCVDGDWGGTPWRRRMTVIALQTGELVIHSPVRMSDADMGELDKLGRVATIVAPNIAHGSEAQWYADRYAAAKVLVPYDAGGVLRKETRIDGTLEDEWPAHYNDELEFFPIVGTRFHEAVFFHIPSKTLIVADLVFNVKQVEIKSRLLKRFAEWNGMVGRFGPTKLFKWVFTSDRYKVRTSLSRIYEWDFERIIMSHGEIVEQGGHELLKSAFAPMFLKMPERRNELRSEEEA